MDPMVQMQWMWQVEMLKSMKRMSRKKGGEDDSSSDEGEKFGGERAFRGVQKLRKRYEAHPEVVIDEYIKRVRRELGVISNTQFWQAVDFTKRIQAQFQKLRGLLRVHYAVSEALQEYLNNRPTHMAAALCLIVQALHQCALDNGNWEAALLLLPGVDHLGRPEFGGDQVAMSEIARYRRAMKELKKSHGGYEKETDEVGATPDGAAKDKKRFTKK